jgi:hypothetical protein
MIANRAMGMLVAPRNPATTLRLFQQTTARHRSPIATASLAAVRAARMCGVPSRAQPRTLTARAITSRVVIRAISDWVAISSFGSALSGSVLVGLSAVAFVADVYR